MARPRQFDPDEALDAALALFWEQGYEATSVQELVERTGVHKRSMYDTFGDKHALFVKALSRYADEQEESFNAALTSSEPAIDTVRGLLEITFTAPPTADGKSWGCMAVNCATELGSRDPDASRRVSLHFERAESVLRDVVERGQRDGEITTRLDPPALAKLLHNAWIGLRVQARAGVARKELEGVVDAAVGVLAP